MIERELIITDEFFFSRRRRHTRCSRDWSSDVCSSDLALGERRSGASPGRHHGVLPGGRPRGLRVHGYPPEDPIQEACPGRSAGEKEDSLVKIGVLLSSNDPESAWNAFRFANTARDGRHDVRVFLMGNSVA